MHPLSTPRQNLKKEENLAQLLSCEFCEIFKNTFLKKTTPVAASG